MKKFIYESVPILVLIVLYIYFMDKNLDWLFIGVFVILLIGKPLYSVIKRRREWKKQDDTE